MQKIMFNDKYGLTKAVLDGIKTQTRRIPDIQPPYENSEICFPTGLIEEDEPEKHPLWMAYCWQNKDNPEEFTPWIKPRYKEGEVVAVAQNYKDLGFSETALDISPKDWRIVRGTLWQSKGWNNKMFVRVDACIEKGHQIRITKVRMQRLQDISEEDCLAEGIYPYYYGDEEEKKRYGIPPNGYSFDGWGFHYPTPREAYAVLIDKISGKGTWEKNPWVWVYDFELVK